MSRTASRALVLFAKDPVAGRVKTRLQSEFDPETVYRIYTCFLKDSIAKICAVNDVDIFIAVTPSYESGFFETHSFPRKPQLFLQEGNDLGERMHRTFEQRFQEGYETVTIIGTDSPTLPVRYIETALASEKDVTLGPSTDGGYYLIGMHGKVTDVFADVAWGSETVLQETLDRVRTAGASLEALPVWYDIDHPEELRFLKTHLEMMQGAGLSECPATTEFLTPMKLEPQS